MNTALALKREVVNSRALNNAIGVAFFILATVLGAYVRIPVPGSPVPITLQTFFVVLSGAVLGRRLGALSQLGYVFLGISGLPVFQGYACGITHLAGPTGGYLVGFVAASFVVGKMLGKGRASFLKSIISFTTGNLVLYSVGVLWLMVLYRISLYSSIAIGVLPFVAVEAVKIFAATLIYLKISDRARNIFS